jgi:hypothetical protein
MATDPTAAVRERVLQLFEQHRAKPGAPCDAAHFLDFLLPVPKKRRAVYDSFRGLRRFNAFIDSVQYEFAVCFSLKDREANYSLDAFVHRVMELQQSRRGSLMSLDHQARAGAGWQALIVLDFVLLILAVWLKGSFGALVAMATVAIAVNAWFLWFAWRARTYLVRLRTRLQSAG